MDTDMHEIIVGNIGSVYYGTDAKEAERKYDVYVKQSCEQYGRAADESVTWFINDNMHSEHVGTVEN